MKKLLFILCAMMLAGFSQAKDLKPYDGKALPDFTLSDMDGTAHTLSSYQGKVVMVNFWATYCPPCIKEMPSMARLKEKLPAGSFEILAIDMGESKEQIESFMERFNIQANFPILLDLDGDVIEPWNVTAAPATFIVDAKGDIRYTYYGGLEWDGDEVVEDITALMQ